MTALYVRSGDTFTEAPHAVVLRCAQRLLSRHFRRGVPILGNSGVVKALVSAQLAHEAREIFAVLLIDGRSRLIEYVELFKGTLDDTQVFPREVVKAALDHRETEVILVHNHPSGDPTPSTADIALNLRLRSALALVDIRVRDHLVVGETITSFVEAGLL